MQASIRAVIMRGGTSRGIFFRDEELPVDPEARTWTILAAFGSPDRYRRQIDGLGGATSLTSKAAIISRGTQPGIDVNFTFGQVSIEKPLIDMRGNYRGSHPQCPFGPQIRLCDTATALLPIGWRAP